MPPAGHLPISALLCSHAWGATGRPPFIAGRGRLFGKPLAAPPFPPRPRGRDAFGACGFFSSTARSHPSRTSAEAMAAAAAPRVSKSTKAYELVF